MKTLLTTLLVLLAFFYEPAGAEPFKRKPKAKQIVTATKQIYLPEFPGACNPSIVKYNDGYLLTFRYLPNRYDFSWISYIGVVILDEFFDPISEPQLLDTRVYNKTTPSQSEDARIFFYDGKYYVIYNDNMEITHPSGYDRRDMFIAELTIEGDQFILKQPLKLYHESKFEKVLWQKNWSPFEWDGKLLFTYYINPHEILYPNLENGVCNTLCETYKPIKWYLGRMRGGTPSQKINDQYYLNFFHSGVYATSTCSIDRDYWHYYMGAYLFSAEPPFTIAKVSSLPIDAPGFYTLSNYDKRIIFPGGFIVDGQTIYLSYGKDDSEMWIATINLNNLIESMVPTNE